MKLIIAPFVTALFASCSVPSTATTDDVAQWQAAVRACNLEDDSSITADVDIHACDPGDTKKTTICHIPPGNPSNAHTICVGNAAVHAHQNKHHDTLGPCASEPPCDGGDDDVDAGTGDGSGSDDGSGSGSGDGSGDGSGSGSGSGSDPGGVIL
jgi:hypothetical protein